MQSYTVLLAYPEHLTDSYGQETYMTGVLANDVRHAIALAKIKASSANSDDDPITWHVLMVCAGRVDDIKHEAEAMTHDQMVEEMRVVTTELHQLLMSERDVDAGYAELQDIYLRYCDISRRRGEPPAPMGDWLATIADSYRDVVDRGRHQ